MKILHICMTQYSDGWTYQENLLAKYHRMLGHDVTMLTSMFCYREGKLIEDTKDHFTDVNGVVVIRLKKVKDGLMGKFPRYRGFFDSINSLEPDIIFSHGCQYVDIKLLVKYIKEHRNVKLFVDNHADFSNSATNLVSKVVLHKIIWKYFAQKLIPYTQMFWGVLPSRVDFLKDMYDIPDEKVNLLVMGADDDLVKRSSDINLIREHRHSFGIEETDFLIVTGGKIDKAKKQTLFLMEAVSKISENRIKLVLFGSIDDEMKKDTLKWVDGKRIIYAGWIKPEVSYDYFAMADLVCFPGRHSVFWEQVVGQGIPMMVRDWSGTHHIDIGGNIKFINDDSVEGIKRTIEKTVISGNEVLFMRQSARAGRRKEFLYSEIAKKSICINDN